MKYIQALLVVGLLAILFRLLIQPQRAQIKAEKLGLAIVFFAVGIVGVIMPDSLTAVAHRLGVGRGADLLLYLVTMATIFGFVSNSLRSREEQSHLITLSRKVALLEANADERNKDFLSRHKQ